MRLGRYCCATTGVRGQLLDKRESNRQGGGILIDAAVGYYPHETDRHEHAQRERLSAINEGLQPLGIRRTAFLIFAICVAEGVDIGYQHYRLN